MKDKDLHGPLALHLASAGSSAQPRHFIQATNENAHWDRVEDSFAGMLGSNVLERGFPLERALQVDTHPVSASP